MRIIKSVMAATLLLQTSVTFGAMAYRIATIDEIQTESSTRVGFENIMYVHQSASWSATSCPASYAYFNAKENPHFVAVVLAAKVSEKPLKVYIDDSLPKVSGIYCQIVNISL